MRLELRELRMGFAREVATSYGTLHERDILVLALTDEDGLTGYGEASPLEPYDGVSLVSVKAALEAYRPLVEEARAPVPDDLVRACRERADLPQALAAVDLALWDLAGRRAGRPVSALLADAPAADIEVNATVSAGGSDEAADAAAAAVRAGFRTVKVKVGAGDDLARVAAVRATVGPEVALRLDANGAWGVDEAVRAIAALAPFGPELVEEPVHGLDALRAVRGRVDVPVAMDETAAEPGAAASGATDAVCLKVSRCGGITALLEQAAQARAAGASVYLASTFDGPLGIAAALHAAAVLAPLPACGLATLAAFTEDDGALAPAGGRVAVPQAAGLGATPFR